MSGEAGTLKADEYAKQFVGDAEAIAFESYKAGYGAALKDAERERDQERDEKELAYGALWQITLHADDNNMAGVRATVRQALNLERAREALQEPAQQGAETAAGEAKPT